MELQTIRLRKLRDFGATISDSVQYLKLYWKPLLLRYLVFVVPFLLVATLLGASSFSRFFAQLSNLEALGSKPFSVFTGGFFVAMLMYFLSTVAYATVVYQFMRHTEEKNGAIPTMQETGSAFLPKMLSNLGYLVLASIGLGVMMLFAIVPLIGILIALLAVIWFAIDLALLFPANTVEDLAFPGAFSRMFRLIRDRWWYTFGVMIIFGLIFYFFSTVINLVVSTIFGLGAVNFLKPADPSTVFTEKYFLVMGLSALVQQIFYLIVHVGVGVHYFSLVEEKDGSGLEAQIDQLGLDKGPHADIEEQY